MEWMTCIYNPVTSRERDWAELRRADRRKRVVVVGAGPAGMEAALVAAQRGHEVVVLDRAGRVGGQVWAAAGSPLRSRFAAIAEFYERQAGKGAFAVRLNDEASADSVLTLEPDAVVIATGSTPRRVELPVAWNAATRPALTVLDALRLDGSPARGGRAVIVDREGHMRAFVVADYLSDRGMQVEFLTPTAEIGPAINYLNQSELYARLTARGVRFRPGEDVLWWQDDATLAAHDVFSAGRRPVEDVGLLVIAAGSEPVNGLAGELAARAPGLECHVIGDACLPRTVEEATVQGGRIGRLL
jgi:NADPH-dependent 2,4-dienoyl-CoA reductase/sulfur reductase-like enzyme